MKIPMKQWRYQEAERLRVSPSTVVNFLSRGKYVLKTVIRKNKRVVLVSENEHLPLKISAVRMIKTASGIVPFRSFAMQEAVKIGVTLTCIYMKARRGEYRIIRIPRNRIKENAN